MTTPSPSTELNMTQRQSRIFRELNANMDYQTMVGVVARYLLTQPGTFLILSEFVYDDEGDLTGVKSLASANRQMTYVTNTFFLRWSQIPTRLRQSVLEDELYVLEDVANLANETTSLDFFKLLDDSGVRSYVHIPVSIDGHPVIGMGIASRELHTFSSDNLDALRNVADQVGAIVYSRTLIERANQSRAVAEDMLQQTQIAAEALGQRVTLLQAINELAMMTASSQDYQTLLDTGSRVVVELTKVNHCGIVIINPDQISATVVSEYPPQNAVGAQLSMENNGLWDALRRDPKTPVMVESPDNDPRLEPLSRTVMKQLGIKSLAIIPLVVDGNLRGGVGLDIYDESRSVTSSMIETATNITAHLSVALRTQELLRDTRQAADQLEAQVTIQRSLTQLSQIVNRAEDEVTLFDATMEAMFKLLKVDHAGLVMLDETSTWGTVVSDYPSQGVLGLKFEVAKNPLLMMMTSQEKAETIVIDDIETSDLFDEAGRASLRQVGTRALLLVPVIVQGKLVGSFGMDYFASGQNFSAQVIDIAVTIMQQFAIGISRLRLLADTRRRADQLEHIARLGQAMQSTQDLGVILREVILETLQVALGALRILRLRLVLADLDLQLLGLLRGFLLPARDVLQDALEVAPGVGHLHALRQQPLAGRREPQQGLLHGRHRMRLPQRGHVILGVAEPGQRLQHLVRPGDRVLHPLLHFAAKPELQALDAPPLLQLHQLDGVAQRRDAVHALHGLQQHALLELTVAVDVLAPLGVGLHEPALAKQQFDPCDQRQRRRDLAVGACVPPTVAVERVCRRALQSGQHLQRQRGPRGWVQHQQEHRRLDGVAHAAGLAVQAPPDLGEEVALHLEVHLGVLADDVPGQSHVQQLAQVIHHPHGVAVGHPAHLAQVRDARLEDRHHRLGRAAQPLDQARPPASHVDLCMQNQGIEQLPRV